MGVDCRRFLASKANSVPHNEKIVNLLIDEIHVKPAVSYKNEKLKACALKKLAMFAKICWTARDLAGRD